MTQKFKVFLLILLTAATALGLAGCERKETKELRKQALPLVGGNPISPLPTPNTQASPLPK